MPPKPKPAETFLSSLKKQLQWDDAVITEVTAVKRKDQKEKRRTELIGKLVANCQKNSGFSARGRKDEYVPETEEEKNELLNRWGVLGLVNKTYWQLSDPVKGLVLVTTSSVKPKDPKLVEVAILCSKKRGAGLVEKLQPTVDETQITALVAPTQESWVAVYSKQLYPHFQDSIPKMWDFFKVEPGSAETYESEPENSERKHNFKMGQLARKIVKDNAVTQETWAAIQGLKNASRYCKFVIGNLLIQMREQGVFSGTLAGAVEDLAKIQVSEVADDPYLEKYTAVNQMMANTSLKVDASKSTAVQVPAQASSGSQGAPARPKPKLTTAQRIAKRIARLIGGKHQYLDYEFEEKRAKREAARKGKGGRGLG